MAGEPAPITIDDHTAAFYLTLDASQIVIFQALIESYEMLATVRTIDVEKNLVSVIAPLDQVDDCQRLLSSLKKEIPWQCAAHAVGGN